MTSRTIRAVGIAMLALPCVVRAQGSLGAQGFGYPAGQAGARAAGTATALAPFDAVSPVNPATITDWRGSVIFFHVQPEFRSTKGTGFTSSTRTSRFPLAGIAERVSRRANGETRAVVGLTFSTYLDRTWETASSGRQQVGADSVDLTTRYSSSGAINDIRLALGWALTPKLRVGAGIHAYTGENRLAISWDFPDSVPFGDVSQTSTLAYGGTGASFGAEWAVSRWVALAAYGRVGGEARLRVSDTLVSKANMPDHLGLAAFYSGLKGTVISGGWERTKWSALAGLGTATTVPRDADKIAVGAETTGPNWHGAPVMFRLGYSHRTLPFDALGSEVKESMVSVGTGFAIARGGGFPAGKVDLALQRAARSAATLSERSWFFTFGLTITP
ncbi:MAG TPA: hypothetical protein VE967_10890 [Gemmatimonadaceae bacterium]|nr:hypothetical protein [Gemmatimonadaceae bacterium]